MEDGKSSDGICGEDEFWTSWMAAGEADGQRIHICVCWPWDVEVTGLARDDMTLGEAV